MKKQTISACIPCHNEIKRVGKVIDSLSKCPYISEIICIDDGSSDGTSKYLYHMYPSVQLIRLKKNIGKSGAVLQGVKTAKNEYVLIMDADLENIDQITLDTAIKKIITTSSIDMIIFRMRHFMWTSKILRHDILLSGNEIIRKNDLLDMFGKMHPFGYELEICLCYYMFIHKKKVGYIWFLAEGISSIQKNNLLWVFRRDILLYSSILFRLGFVNYLKLTLSFCRKRFC